MPRMSGGSKNRKGRARKFDSVGSRKAKKDAPASLPSTGSASSAANQRGASFGAERGSRRGFSGQRALLGLVNA